MELDVFKRHALRLFGVAEAYTVEIDGAILHVIDGVFGVGERAFFLKHRNDTVAGLIRDCDHHKHHREHHQAHERLKAVNHQRGKLADVEVEPLRGDDDVGTEG